MLKHQIINLIQEKREGCYWDFKAEYHKDKAELLHDIICLSNNLSNQEAYLILGVTDNGHILGIASDPNRKTQEELISFVTGKKFAAGRHPKVSLMTFEYEEKEIDVIIINPKGYAPYYLEKAETDQKSKKNKTVNAGSIYTRVEDKNTPINSTASPLDTETLWKMHFGLYPTPIKRLQNYLLTPEKWIPNSTGYFYSESPEYIVYKNEDIEEKENYFNLVSPFYAYNQINSNSLHSYYEFKYHSTVLYGCRCISLDSGNYKTPVPEFGVINPNVYQDGTLYYRYFIESSMLYNIHLFMYEGNSMEEETAMNKFKECVLFFESDTERNLFEDYILNNLEKVNQAICENHTRVFGIEHMTVNAEEDITKSIKTVKVLKDELENYRKINK
ncbi:ATP-binding protein [Staphylococcus xylosus]|uniref:AlbA family DNA-binding domain-containing protein n=1 Tax=Staphylococcus TaxID=1279 RepID=UPI0009368B69|nr:MULTISPECIES: ATP-binding protein [Staphylococcus]MEB7660091.1 ATP-binding protein [Staphylococcus xylosus]MEB7709979.1 ATP-binding protein [Staphylococcus xylosus]MEB7785730.1 ATP-binding protein [Staphylococcus xylosus]